MKTIHKILGGILAVILVVVMALNVNFSAKSNDFSDSFLANVEALAKDETTDVINCPGGPTECARVAVGNTLHLFYKP